MSQHRFRSPASNDLPLVVPPTHARRWLTRRQLLLLIFLSILLLTGVLGDWSFRVKPVYAASTGAQTDTSQNGLTFQQFVSEGRPDHAYHGYPIIPANSPSRVKTPKGAAVRQVNPLPSAEPPRMKPIALSLSSAFLTAGSTGTSLDLRGSDGRLEVLVSPGAFDLSHATVAGGTPPNGSITLHLTQIAGHFIGFLHQLGTYQMQLVDSQGHVIDGIKLRTPITFVYHYQQAELDALGLDAGRLSMTWPTLLVAEQKAHAKVINATIPLRNDPLAHTLTTQSSVLDSHIFDMGGGNPGNQAPPTLHLDAVQGNSGQFTYSFPLYEAPGPNGFKPQLALQYSSSGPNERHSLTSSANDVGDGWNLSLGSITTETYPDGSLYYFINGVAGAGDRLLPGSQSGFYDTAHISYLKIQYTGGCFKVWDKSGTYYELGCTSDSLQYSTNTSGVRTNYRWDVNKIVAPNEGSGAGAYRMVLVKYLQDTSQDSGGHTTVRDAAIEQITYGVASSPNNTTFTTVDGTLDYHYLAPVSYGSWADAYNYGTNYNCSSGTQPGGHPTNLRCDDPEQDTTDPGAFTAPTVFSSLSLQAVQSYVGDDSAVSHLAYRYDFAYNDTAYGSCTDPVSGKKGYCAGEHVLTSVTPTVYQYVNSQSQPHALRSVVFTYTSIADTYSDQSQSNVGGNPYYQVKTTWQYLSSYFDNDTGEGVHITYSAAYNNAHGTPTDNNYLGQGITDDRYDPFYCPNHVNASANLQCTGVYAPYDDRAWEEQVVTQLQAWGSDGSGLAAPTVQYHYVLAYTGQHNPANGWCMPDQNGGEAVCVGDNWLPPGDTDWSDYYHAEYQGFAQVLMTSPAGDLTVANYYSTDGWYTPETDYLDFLGGTLQSEQVYRGTLADPTKELQSTGSNFVGTTDACKDGTPTLSPVYYACETVLLTTTTISYEQTSNYTQVQHTYSYDDYSNGAWHTGNVYHNLTQDQVSGTNLGANLATPIYPLKKNLTYTWNDTTTTNPTWTYYTVDKATHSETDDATGHAWQCQDTAYDENTGNTKPAAGWPTTTVSYTNGCNANSAVTTYNFYDQYGNTLATVDGAGAATPSLYSGSGCTVSLPGGAAKGIGWSQSYYTTCSTYDSYFAQPLSQSKAFNISTSSTYDYTQGSLPVIITAPNTQQIGYTYSYDSSGNRTIQVMKSPDASHYTTQSSTNSSCSSTATTPCYEVDTISYQYNTVTARTFYDSMGRAVETRTPGPGTYDTISITMYNDQAHAVWKSNPFEVASGSGYLDPQNEQVTDRLGHIVPGTATFYDAMGRVIAVQNQNNANDGFACSHNLSGNYTSCTNYSVGQASNISGGGVTDTSYYVTVTTIDPDKHVSVTYADALGRAVYLEIDGGAYNGTLIATTLKTIQYNALDKVTSLQVIDLAASGAPKPSVTTTASYNDLGWLTGLNDPDRGNHAFTYDNDGRLIVDAVGSRTLGYIYDLLGRLGCVEDVYPSFSPSGACSGGTHLVQNTYDSSKLTVTGTTDYPIGQLTQSVALTVFSDGTTATTTESFEHDIRGNMLAEKLQISNLPGSWNVTTALPTYQVQNSYNDANQLTSTTSTSSTGQSFTTYSIYNSANGWLTGIGKTSGVANLASYSYGVNTQVSDINFKTSTNSALLDDQFTYDNELRPTGMTAAWQSGSGASGNAFSQTRTYDAASNPIMLTTTQAVVSGVSNSGGSETQVFCYDERNRLVWAGNTGTPSCSGNGTPGVNPYIPAYSNSYAYTNLGQLSSGPFSGSGSYQYLYCNGQPHALTGLYQSGSTCSNKTGQVYAASYDSFGNVISRTANNVTDTMSYDKFDHMTNWSANVTGQTQQEQYMYDATGNRVLRRSTSGPSGSPTTIITTYAFGLEDFTYSGSGTYQSTLYYYALGGRLIGSNDGTNITFYLTDALGSVLSSFSNTVNAAVVKANQLFGPYGVQRYNAGTINTAKGFTGQYSDSLTGLDYYNARYYDPMVGGFMSADVEQGNAQGMNPYAYVHENPETFADPTGQRAIPVCGYPGGPGCGSGEDAGSVAPGGLAAPNLPPQPTPPPTPILFNANYKLSARQFASDLAQYIQLLRRLRNDTGAWNYAMGVWYITDSLGNIIEEPWLMSLFPTRSQRAAKGGDRYWDSEQILLREWQFYFQTTALTMLKDLLVAGIDAQLHLVVYTQIPPCGACQAYFPQFMQNLNSELFVLLNTDPKPLFPTPTLLVTLDIYASSNSTNTTPGTVSTLSDVRHFPQTYTSVWQSFIIVDVAPMPFP